MKQHILDKIQAKVALSRYATLGVGGPASYFIAVETIEEMVEAILYCNQSRLRYLVIGKGSNVLFDDRGFDGLVILNAIAFFEEIGAGEFHVGAGYSFSLLGTKTARAGWSGLEFASGIPGSVGGALFMNAGASGKETADALAAVDFVDSQGVLRTLEKKEIEFCYRSSSFHQWGGAIVGATFRLIPSELARAEQKSLLDYRISTQPYGEKSAGCIFRNPKGESAGRLIEKAGLKGMRIGGAEVSQLHANFIVAKEGALASDILELINYVKQQVKEKMQADLREEVRIIAYKSP